jgi:hypothetical protein
MGESAILVRAWLYSQLRAGDCYSVLGGAMGRGEQRVRGIQGDLRVWCCRCVGLFVPLELCGVVLIDLIRISDVVAIVADSLLFVREQKAFRRATGADAELGEGEITI